MGLLLTIKSRLNSAKLTQLTVNTIKDGQVCCPAGTNLYEVGTITDNGRYVYKLIYSSFKFFFFNIYFLTFYTKLFKVDLYVGLLMEEPVSGGELGPTSLCIIAHQAR